MPKYRITFTIATACGYYAPLPELPTECRNRDRAVKIPQSDNWQIAITADTAADALTLFHANFPPFIQIRYSGYQDSRSQSIEWLFKVLEMDPVILEDLSVSHWTGPVKLQGESVTIGGQVTSSDLLKEKATDGID